MKTITIQERLHDKCIKACSTNELMEITTEFTNEITDTDAVFWSIDKRWCGYGSWKTECFVNEYHFGKELAEAIKEVIEGRVTHDEDKVFTLEDFRDAISEAVFSLANDYFNE